MAGEKTKVLKWIGELRLEIGRRLGLLEINKFAPLWVTDFPLFEWSEEDNRYYAKHHPFTSPKKEDIEYLYNNQLDKVRANAYDIVINGVEIGGGSIRIHNKELQQIMFKCLGISKEESERKFGFLMNAFRYGAPPHGGIAIGFDRLCAVMNGVESIREFISFPKNNSARDIMIDCPSELSENQLEELGIMIKKE